MLKAPTFYKGVPVISIDLSPDMQWACEMPGDSRHAPSAHVFSGDGPLLAEVGQELEQGTAESGPDRDTGPFCCNILFR